MISERRLKPSWLGFSLDSAPIYIAKARAAV
jgi:hypothetical protein